MKPIQAGPHLGRLLDAAAGRRPEGVAVEEDSGREATYGELARAADRVAARLARWGVGRGDRVGLFLPKSIEAVAAIHAILKTGAAYVPVDPTAPVARASGILLDAGVKAAIVGADLAAPLRETDAPASRRPVSRRIVVGAEPGDAALRPEDATWDDVLADDAPSPLWPVRATADLAYILYTSGSTGRPKGVALSHANAFAFLDWCEAHLAPRDDDRFASHAPFHFDLSVFDIYTAARHAAPLILIGDALARDPVRLGSFVSDRRIDVWYSAPSALALLADRGGLEREGRRAPRLVLFAGEVFPIARLRRLRNLWPDASMWNLYGPTETNVCTAYRVPEAIDPERTTPLPIGMACEPHRARVVDEAGVDVAPGAVGELIVSGPGVMRGYFGRPDLTDRALVRDDAGTLWYRTGDLAADDEDGGGVYIFHGRRDRMVKKRGYRIELGEVESALDRHDSVARAAVVARVDSAEGGGPSLAAFVALKPAGKPSIIAMKRHCMTHLPHYMVPDTITFVDAMPTTSTDKVDYPRLAEIAAAAGVSDRPAS